MVKDGDHLCSLSVTVRVLVPHTGLGALTLEQVQDLEGETAVGGVRLEPLVRAVLC